MGRHDRGLRAAIKAAFDSDFTDHKVGAALYKGARLLSVGANYRKSHPESTCWTQHAEFSTLLGFSAEELSGTTLYVARLTRTNRISFSKPCEYCQRVILKKGLSKVFYTNYDGLLDEMDLATLAPTVRPFKRAGVFPLVPR